MRCLRAREDYSESLAHLLEELTTQKKIDTIEKDENLFDSYYNLYSALVG